MPAMCPVCNRNDQIQLVSAIVQAGTTRSRYSGPVTTMGDGGSVQPGWVSGSTTSMSSLAARLAPPEEPSAPGPSCGGLISVVVTTPILAAPLLIGFFAWAQFPGAAVFVFLCTGLALVVCLLVWLILLNATFKEDGRAQEEYRAKHKIWQERVASWRQLYYCHRDGVVFDPETGSIQG